MKGVLSVHSSRGGTGKTVIAVNLAATLFKKGFSISLLDMDFRAPSLNNIFMQTVKTPVRYWLNDYFNGKCEIGQALFDVSKNFNKNGKFLIGLANPSVNAVIEMLGKSKSWEASALKKLYSLKSVLVKDMDIDYIIYDTSPGIQYSSINAVISSDLTLVVTTSDPLDNEGLRNMLAEFNELFEKKTLIIVNKALPQTEPFFEEKKEESATQLERTLDIPVVGAIPCYCDVLKTNRDYLFSLKDPTHPFARALEEISEKIIKY